LVINPMLGKVARDYDAVAGCQIVTGERYAMIRSEFRRARGMRGAEPGGPPRALVALGGGDVVDDSIACVKAIMKSGKIDSVDVALGAAPRNNPKISAMADQFGDKLSFTFDAKDLGVRMSKAHVMVTGAGNTSLEAACVGIPMILVARGARQAANANWLEDCGVAHRTGDAGKIDLDKLQGTVEMIMEDNFERKTLSRAGRKLIDGRGPDRIVTATEVLVRRSRTRTVAAAA
jgi:spore coat polysaccharide biosynthesis predicted glycosyltransferase SpsG